MALLLASLLLAAAPAAQEPAAPPKPAPPWQQVVVLGASASAGFGTNLELGEQVSLAAVIEPMLALPHQPVQSFASEYFFLNPGLHGANQVQDALEASPTLVVALDYLFWFVYGFFPDEEHRLANLDQGLKLLESFDCPVLISLIPDMSAAIGTMLAEGQVPAPVTFGKANDRIRAWAGKHGKVRVVPVNELVEQVHAGKPVTVGASSWKENVEARLIQADHLHPTLEGLAALAALSLQALAQSDPAACKDAFRLDPLAAADAVRRAHASRDPQAAPAPAPAVNGR